MSKLKKIYESSLANKHGKFGQTGVPFPTENPNEFAYLDFKKWVKKKEKNLKKVLARLKDDKRFKAVELFWKEWDKKANKGAFSNIRGNKFGRELTKMLWKDNLLFDKKSHKIVKLKEDIKIPIKVGDTVLGGKFKNKKIVVKSIGTNEKGDITINGKPLLRYRTITEASTQAFGDGEPESGYLPKGKKRTLGTKKGKSEKWFDQGGYTQLDFPEADDIYGKGNKPDLQVKKTTTPTAEPLTLKEIMTERRKLTVFDFDDTLAQTDSWVYVNKNGKRVAQLDPGEFAIHKLKAGEDYDFSDFDKKLRNPKLIRANAIEFRKQSDHARRTPSHQITILTARGLGYPVKHWFKKLGMDVYVVALKSADPKKKADYIEKKIQSGYTDIYFIDDSPKNIKAVQALQKKYPKIKIKTVKA